MHPRLPLKPTLKSQKGSILLNVIGVVMILGVVAISLISWRERQLASLNNMMTPLFIEQVSSKTYALVIDDQAWQQTENCYNSTPDCPQGISPGFGNNGTPTQGGASGGSGPGSGSFALLNQDGSLFYDSRDPSNGWNNKGERCTGFTPEGNDDCPLRLDLMKSGADGKAAHIKATFTLKNKSAKVAVNTTRYDFDLPQRGKPAGSLKDICESIHAKRGSEDITGVYDDGTKKCSINFSRTGSCPPGSTAVGLNGGTSDDHTNCTRVVATSASACGPKEAISGYNPETGLFTCRTIPNTK